AGRVPAAVDVAFAAVLRAVAARRGLTDAPGAYLARTVRVPAASFARRTRRTARAAAIGVRFGAVFDAVGAPGSLADSASDTARLAVPVAAADLANRTLPAAPSTAIDVGLRPVGNAVAATGSLARDVAYARLAIGAHTACLAVVALRAIAPAV